MKPDDVQQLAQSFVASWETQLARALREPHMLSSLMGMMQQGGYASANPSASNPWAGANPFASAANPFAQGASHASSPSGFTSADTTAHAQSGAAAGPDHTQRIAALEHALAALSQRVAELEQQLAHDGAHERHGRNESAGADAKRPAKARSRATASAAATGTGSRKPAAKKA